MRSLLLEDLSDIPDQPSKVIIAVNVKCRQQSNQTKALKLSKIKLQSPVNILIPYKNRWLYYFYQESAKFLWISLTCKTDYYRGTFFRLF